MSIPLLLAQLVLVGLGWVGVATARPEQWLRHAMYTLIAVLVTLVISKAKPHTFVRFAPYFWALTIAGLVATLILGRFLGNGSVSRWIDLGPANIQFSEFAKLGLILYLTNFFTRRGLDYKLYGPVFVIGLTSGLVVLAPSVSAGVFVFLIGITVMFIAGIGLFRIISILLFALMVAIPVGSMLVNTFPYVAQRIEGFYSTLQGEIDCQGYAFQVCNTKRILERAGVVGLGPDVPMRPNFFGSSTDFVIAPIAHATGLIGVGVVIAMFCIILYLGFRTSELVSKLALQTRDPERQTNLQVVSVLAASGTLMIVAQAVVNLGVSIGSLPNTGMTLPMVSYGGSSLIALGVAFGWLQAAHREVKAAHLIYTKRTLTTRVDELGF